MKIVINLFLASGLLASPTFCTAATTDELTSCSGDGYFAQLIAQSRLMPGADLNDMMAKFGGEPGLREMVLAAFELPLVTTEPARSQLAEEFGNTWSLKCYRDGPAIPDRDTGN